MGFVVVDFYILQSCYFGEEFLKQASVKEVFKIDRRFVCKYDFVEFCGDLFFGYDIDVVVVLFNGVECFWVDGEVQLGGKVDGVYYVQGVIRKGFIWFQWGFDQFGFEVFQFVEGVDYGVVVVFIQVDCQGVDGKVVLVLIFFQCFFFYSGFVGIGVVGFFVGIYEFDFYILVFEYSSVKMFEDGYLGDRLKVIGNSLC